MSRIHVVSLPHTQVTAEYCWCAYTAKVRRFCNMMTDLGHDVFLYAGTKNEARVKEFITVVSDEKRNEWFGNRDWNREVFGGWNINDPWWVEMNAKANNEIQQRMQKGDFLGIIAGRCQEMLVQAIPQLRAVEWGVGYEGILNGLRVFESYAWMHHLYGKYNINDGRFFDAVIPNAFEEDEFDFSVKKDDYLLYLGRLTPRKGLEIVELLAKKGHRVVTAGQGDLRLARCEHLGVVRGEQKRQLLARAKAILVPTLYIEPFGGVAVEAMLSGTPVITTDFGAFTETVIHGETGFRCHTMAEFEDAADMVEDLYPKRIRLHAEQYLTQNIRHKYDSYFKRVSLLDGDGWYTSNKERRNA